MLQEAKLYDVGTLKIGGKTCEEGRLILRSNGGEFWLVRVVFSLGGDYMYWELEIGKKGVRNIDDVVKELEKEDRINDGYSEIFNNKSAAYKLLY